MDGGTEGHSAHRHDHAHEHHIDVGGGGARAAVFGVSDGLVSNIALVLGVAGGTASGGIVRLAGVVGLLGGAFSMAAGEYVSMRAQAELLGRELDKERAEIKRVPDAERQELAQIYRSRGVAADVADELAAHIMRNPEVALEVHAREELGIDPTQLGNPPQAAASSFAAFCIGAAVPLLPWFFLDGVTAVLLSLTLGVVGAAVIGLILSRFTGRSAVTSAARHVLIAALAAGVPFLVGRAVGVSV